MVAGITVQSFYDESSCPILYSKYRCLTIIEVGERGKLSSIFFCKNVRRFFLYLSLVLEALCI